MKKYLQKLGEKIKQKIEPITNFLRSPSHSRTFLLLGMLILILAIPVTVTFLGQQTNFFQHAMISGDGGKCTAGVQHTCNGQSYVTYDINADCSTKIVSSVKVCGQCNYKGTDSPRYQICDFSKKVMCGGYYNECTQKTTINTKVAPCTTVPGQCGAPSPSPIPPVKFYCSDSTHFKDDPNSSKAAVGGTWSCPTGYTCSGSYSTLKGSEDAKAALCKKGPDYSGCTNFFVGSDQLEINCQNEAKKQRASCTYSQYYKYSGDSCVFAPPTTVTPSPAQLPLPDPNSIRCGTTSNPGVCYFYRSSAIPGVGCDPNAYSNTPGHACDSSSFQNLPSCDTMVKSATGYSGSQNINSNSSCLAVKVSGFTSNVDQNVIHAQCCSLIAVNNPSPAASSNSCTQHGGTCQSSSSQGLPASCTNVLNISYSNECGGNATCCGACKTSSDCNSGQTCSSGKCVASPPSGHNYGTCAGLDKANSICTDTKCPAGFDKTASNACSGSVNGLTKICCTRSSSSGNGGTGGTGGTGGDNGGSSSCTNGKTTKFTLNLKLDGIGTESFSNHTPAHTTRPGIYVKVTDQNGTVLYNNTSTTFTYNTSSGTFNAPKVDLSTKLSCGHTYSVTVKIPRYLPVKGTVDYGTDKTISLNPIAGDINKVDPSSKIIIGDDKIDVNDYSIMRTCRNIVATTSQTFTSGSTTVTLTCGDLVNFLDYSDGGTTGDEWSFNYNEWARGFIKAN